MMNGRIGQIAAWLVAVVTPWIVARVAVTAVSRYVLALGLSVPPNRAIVPLGWATAASALTIGALAALLPLPSGWMAVIVAAAFVGLSALGLRALRELDAATHVARYVDSTTRTAGLVGRRRFHYLPSSWQILLFGATFAGLALFAWRIAIRMGADRRLWLPIAFALVAVVFLWLYEVWIHALVTGPAVAAGLEARPSFDGSADSDPVRRRFVRIVFATEAGLVVGFLALAHGLLGVDWTARGAWAAILLTTGGVLGVIGCALALSSDLLTRRYRVIR
jgi:hypothetical protein